MTAIRRSSPGQGAGQGTSLGAGPGPGPGSSVGPRSLRPSGFGSGEGNTGGGSTSGRTANGLRPESLGAGGLRAGNFEPAPPLQAAPAAGDAGARRKVANRPAARPRRHGIYAAAWACSGLIAGAYVFTLILRHDGGPLLARSDRESVDVAALTKAQNDVARLQDSVGRLEGDVARIKIDQAAADAREKKLVERVTGVETRVTQFGEQIAAAMTPPAPIAKGAKAPPPPPLAQARPPAAKPAAAPIATASIPKRAPAPGPVAAAAPAAAARAPAEAAAGILLARGPSLDALRLSWNLLNERHKGTLKSMEPRVVEVEPGTYQLLAGPVANPAEALKVCGALKARGVACQPADYKGNAL